jgi:hypothetical protein
MAQTPAPKNRVLAAFLAWLVPGLGHFYQGRTAKGVLYAVCILGLYFVGFALGEMHNVYWRWINPLHNAEEFRFSYICQFFVGLPALPALIQATLKHYDLAPIFWGFMAVPDPAVINAAHPKLGKLVEVGSVYTMVAGLLNVLAIYDAFDGPAYSDEEEAGNAPDAEGAAAEAVPAEAHA